MKTPWPALRSMVLLPLATLHCGSAVIAGAAADASPADAAPADAAPVDAPPADVPAPEPTPACDVVAAQCNTAPQQLFRASATGLAGLDGALARVAVRYLLQEGDGLMTPRGVVEGRAVVRGGAFEACACIPRNANGYPEVAAAVIRPGAVGDRGRDVARGFYSQRFAVVGPEDMTVDLERAPSPVVAEAALAAFDARATVAALRGLTSVRAGAIVYAGLVADERPTAALVTQAPVADGGARLVFTMPGRAWPSERMVFVVDVDGDRACGAADVGASVVRDAEGGAAAPVALLQGAALQPVCDALRLGEPRG